MTPAQRARVAELVASGSKRIAVTRGNVAAIVTLFALAGGANESLAAYMRTNDTAIEAAIKLGFEARHVSGVAALAAFRTGAVSALNVAAVTDALEVRAFRERAKDECFSFRMLEPRTKSWPGHVLEAPSDAECRALADWARDALRFPDGQIMVSTGAGEREWICLRILKGAGVSPADAITQCKGGGGRGFLFDCRLGSLSRCWPADPAVIDEIAADIERRLNPDSASGFPQAHEKSGYKLQSCVLSLWCEVLTRNPAASARAKAACAACTIGDPESQVHVMASRAAWQSRVWK